MSRLSIAIQRAQQCQACDGDKSASVDRFRRDVFAETGQARELRCLDMSAAGTQSARLFRSLSHHQRQEGGKQGLISACEVPKIFTPEVRRVFDVSRALCNSNVSQRVSVTKGIVRGYVRTRHFFQDAKRIGDDIS
jgi:hypothetical protein